jgi:4-amino-4-deoxy-L-arabinose transferase-like glycosyltransferase
MRTKYLFILLAMGALLFLFRIGGRDLWEPDETQYAIVAQEMKETGNPSFMVILGDFFKAPDL